MRHYNFYSIDTKDASKSTLIGGGDYESDQEAIRQGFDYADIIKKTLGMITTDDRPHRIVWTLRQGRGSN